MLRHLYWINAALLATHEVDSGYWKEWNLFGLPGGLPGFLLLHVFLFLLMFWGFEEVVRGRRRGLWLSMLLSGSGLFALVAHGTFLLRGGADFRTPASILLLLAIGAVSIAQAAVTWRAMRDRSRWTA